MRILLLVLSVCLPFAVRAQTVRLETGTLVLPRGFVHQGLRGTDSFPGIVRRTDSTLVIHYDIGHMAGIQVHPSRESTFLWMTQHEVAGHAAYTGAFMRNGKRWLGTSITGTTGEPWTLPANFLAVISSDRDVADFMAIVTSYRRKGQSEAK